MIRDIERIDGLVQPVGDDRGRERGGAGRDSVLVDLPAKPPVQVSGLACQLEATPGADVVGFALGLVLPLDHHVHRVERLHPGVEVEDLRAGETLRRLRVSRRRDAFPHCSEQFVPADPGQRMLLRVEQDIDKHTVLRRHLIRGEVSGDVEAPGKADKFPGVGTGNAHDPL